MEFSYVAYNKDRKLIKGKLSASNESAASNLLGSSGYQVLSLKAQSSFLNSEKLNMTLGNVNPKEIIMFSRQMALLLSSGTDIVASLELLQTQVADRSLKRNWVRWRPIYGEVLLFPMPCASIRAYFPRSTGELFPPAKRAAIWRW